MFSSKWSSTEQLVAQDWIEEASKKNRVGRHCACCPRLCYKRACVEALYLYCGAICLIATVLFLVFATGVVAPFHKSLTYIATSCRTLSTTYAEKPQMCWCSGRHCHSSYPCAHILVRYNTTEEVEEEAQLYSSQYTDGKCSYAPQCSRLEDTNKNHVTEFVGSFGIPNVTFDCLYNPDDVTHVIRIREGSHDSMLHLLLWPGLVAMICGMGVIIPYMVCGCGFLWKRHPPMSIKQEAQLRARGIVLSEYSHMDPSQEPKS